MCRRIEPSDRTVKSHSGRPVWRVSVELLPTCSARYGAVHYVLKRVCTLSQFQARFRAQVRTYPVLRHTSLQNRPGLVTLLENIFEKCTKQQHRKNLNNTKLRWQFIVFFAQYLCLTEAAVALRLFSLLIHEFKDAHQCQ